ncbi:hypothetical protein BDV40DRAFT_281248 [Aspergillus tamarii]|uniref:Uncharacterized protein n=1 Tax=Aspergillus tamarii TaxID=41984 RepID=A0A5N6UCV7_ASPTM|nr:hypothetical protein BDV40DRAFT_281248 [Aspergillus tamarii]
MMLTHFQDFSLNRLSGLHCLSFLFFSSNIIKYICIYIYDKREGYKKKGRFLTQTDRQIHLCFSFVF